MDKSSKVVLRAKFIYYFKETFRAHSKAEYREIFSRGLNDDNGGLTGTFPWLYVRAFFALFILFTLNVLVLRLTNNTLYVPSVTFLGGITFSVPFIILLYELYPKRDLSLFMLLGVLVGGGTAAGLLSQLVYAFINTDNSWITAVAAGLVEEFCKMIPAVLIIILANNKNPYACFLLAAAVGAGFSVVEDMGYIFYYSDKFVFDYHSDIQATIAIFADRGISSFCTHILWTGAVGWAYSISKRPFRSVWLVVFAVSVALHISWDLPLEGVYHGLVIAACVIIAAAINITVVHKSRINTLAREIDLTHVNEVIITEAKTMGEQMRFTNAANLTFALTCALLSVIILVLCSLPIGIEFSTVEYESSDRFIAAVEGGYHLKADWNRSYDENGENVVELWGYDEDEKVLSLTYVEQKAELTGYDGVYYFQYYLSDKTKPFGISLELENKPSRITCKEYTFDDETKWVFEVEPEVYREYTYHKNGTVTAVTEAEKFEGYNFLIALCATGFSIAAGCTIIIIALRIKLWRVRNEGL